VDRLSDPVAGDVTTRPANGRQRLTSAGSPAGAVDLDLGGLAAIVRSSHQAIVTVDRDVRFVTWNAGAEQLLGYRAAEIIGRRAPDMLAPADRVDEARMLHQRALAGETIERFETQRLHKDGSLVDMELSVYPVVGAGGEITGMGLIARDLAEDHRTRDLVRSQSRLLDVLHGSPGSAPGDGEELRSEGRGTDFDERVWIKRIRDALERDALVLQAQPIFDLSTGEAEFRELLLKMRDEHGALIPPSEFLPIAERFGLIGQIDRWVIDKAARVARDGRVTFNVSAVSVADPQLAGWIEAAIRRNGVAADALVCEITESAMLKDPRPIEAFVDRLTRMGLSIALDDFGMGYGGLAYLKRIPASYLKIATEFVRDLPHNAASAQIVEAIVKLARGFEQDTIAEGVEDPSILDVVRRMGVTYGQGFGLARPAPVDIAASASP
jgi:PAS domain S-box-containing protein